MLVVVVLLDDAFSSRVEEIMTSVKPSVDRRIMHFNSKYIFRDESEMVGKKYPIIVQQKIGGRRERQASFS